MSEPDPWEDAVYSTDQLSSDEFLDLLGDTLTGNMRYEWRVRTWDTQEEGGPWSDWEVFDAIPMGAAQGSGAGFSVSFGRTFPVPTNFVVVTSGAGGSIIASWDSEWGEFILQRERWVE